jgi:hypothetical protein
MQKLKPSTPVRVQADRDDGEDFITFENHTESSAPDELTAYLADKSRTLSSLDAFPKVKELFVMSNAALPSSASVERLFSCAGLIFTPNRACVDDNNLEAKVLLKFNK